jgi:hypothetical protein
MEPGNKKDLIQEIEKAQNDFGYQITFVGYAEFLIEKALRSGTIKFREALDVWESLDQIWHLGRFEDRREKNALRRDK